ncbi:MAG: prepilin-type N-terminal cleavage/methylation domain-containing protein [Candidatus Tectomicrobia bacterium]|uniref:Prepilin-type N-terminal cleavage/methylation domain-containing protein n=1 Tax=Tectimicrobiota bacterium TaxID=2528274 RepID=A0A932FZ41_UNCTE|nr:prepilin-type N-terminal cleavage/methylation domain-containing protein [Candidatus Tectomicrobia bacterium]
MEKMRYPEGGFTLIEVFISLAITGLIMTSAYGLFIGQNKSYQAQQDTIRLFREAQNAMGILAKDLRMTGYGVPQAASRITVANGTTLTVSGNFRRVSTTLSAVAASGQTALPVQGITGFAVGDAIWITNGTNSESKTISGISGGGSPSLTVNSSLSNSYNAASMVHQNRTLTYTYTGGAFPGPSRGGRPRPCSRTSRPSPSPIRTRGPRARRTSGRSRSP